MDQTTRQRRRARIRSRIHGTAVRPRAAVFRSLRYIGVQLIDDVSGRTLASASSRGAAGKLTKTQGAEAVGKQIAEAALAAGITKISFDRGGYRYHGRIKALASAMREAGLDF